jgi:hypothetical protein
LSSSNGSTIEEWEVQTQKIVYDFKTGKIFLVDDYFLSHQTFKNTDKYFLEIILCRNKHSITICLERK